MAISEATPGPALATPLEPRRLLTDEQLARRAAGGDPRAFEAIFARHHQELYRYCRALVGNADDAEDALQATMAAALRSLPGETRPIALRPWLYRVAHNEAISIVRHRPPVAECADFADEGVVGVEQQAESRRRIRQLVADLGTLPERQRSALVMRELSGLSYEEIAAALGASGAAARQTVYEARLALAELEAGREMDCDTARRAISERDGRLLRGRRIRAHLRACEGCRNFRATIPRRRADLAALAPPLPALAAGGILASILGGSGGGTAGAISGGAGASLGGAAGGATAGGGGAAGALGVSAGVKAASVVAAVAVSAGAADVTGVVRLPLVGGSGAPHARSAPASPTTSPPAHAPAAAHREHARAVPATSAGPSGPAEASRSRPASGGREAASAPTTGASGRTGAVGQYPSAQPTRTSGTAMPPPPGKAVGHARSHPPTPAPTGSRSDGAGAPPNANGLAHRSSASQGARRGPPGQTKPAPPDQRSPGSPGQTKPAPPGETKPAPPGETKPAPLPQTQPQPPATPPSASIASPSADASSTGNGHANGTGNAG